MITELNKHDFYKVQHLTDNYKNIEVRSIVNGNNPGRIYVDHPAEITAALIWIQGQEGFQIVGDARSKFFLTGLEGFIRGTIEPDLKNQSINCVELGVELDTWDKSIQMIFNNRQIFNSIQHVFRLKEYSHSIEFQDNDEVTVRRIDDYFFNSSRLENHSFLEKKIFRFWDSIDSFLQQGFGYFAEYKNKAISLCLSAFVADQTHAVDIETLDGFKRRSYGTKVASAFVQECKHKGIVPYWDCTPLNTGSIRLAKALGLSHDFDYRIFRYDL